MPAEAAPATPESVARHYDEIDPFYRWLWGEHLHHGVWATGRETPEEAVRALISLVAEAAGVRAGSRVVDIGCGYGGTARVLTREHGARVTGLTVSRAQLRYAQDASGGAGAPRFLLRDWQENGLPDGEFDAAVAIESTEHMADKPRVFAEAFRVLKPGGRLVVCAWLRGDGVTGWKERRLVRRIVAEGRLAGLDTQADYLGWMRGAGLVPGPARDLSRQVRKTWAVCTARVARGLLTRIAPWRYLLDRRNTDRVFVLTVPRIWLAYRTGAMRYVLFTAIRPAAGGADTAPAPRALAAAR